MDTLQFRTILLFLVTYIIGSASALPKPQTTPVSSTNVSFVGNGEFEGRVQAGLEWIESQSTSKLAILSITAYPSWPHTASNEGEFTNIHIWVQNKESGEYLMSENTRGQWSPVTKKIIKPSAVITDTPWDPRELRYSLVAVLRVLQTGQQRRGPWKSMVLRKSANARRTGRGPEPEYLMFAALGSGDSWRVGGFTGEVQPLYRAEMQMMNETMTAATTTF